MHSVMGKRMYEVGQILMPTVPENKRDELLHLCEINENSVIEKEGGELFDYVEEILDKLSKEYKLFIISNCGVGYIEAFLSYYKFKKYITDTENPGVTGLGKGDNITLVAKRNNIDKIIYLGDTSGDYLATKQAGGTFIHAAYGFGTVEEETIKINCISDLPDAIEKIINSEEK